jgi:hypothetical protein
MSKITMREYRNIFDKEQPPDEEDRTIAKVYGLSPDELIDLSFPDYKRLAAAFFDAARDPVTADPN